MSNLQVFIPTMTQYFDENDKSNNPISNIVLMNYFTTDPILGESYLFKLSQNYAIIKDSAFSNNLNIRNQTFYSFRPENTYTKIPDLGFNTPI